MIAGRYSRDREIGRGGSGVVWLGRDELLGRQVALKRIGLLPGADVTDLARAEREARLSARLAHRHVVSVFDVVVDPETQDRWLVMEYVDGLTLGEVVRRQGPLSPDEAAPLLLQAADALAAAHEVGITHRDVKPSNILVDRSWQVRLTDFGIARITSDPALTQTGMVTGSPAYLAPEIATGGRGDQSGDVWSLGATAYYLLAGRTPYDMGENVLAGLYRMVHEEPPRLDDAGWLAPLLEGTMVRDPEQRWTMAQVRDFLADPQHRAPAVASAPSSAAASEAPTTLLQRPAGRPAHRTSRRRPLALLLGVAAAVLLVVGLVAWVATRGGSDGGSDGGAASGEPSASGSAGASGSPSASASASPSASPSATPSTAAPTAAGMEAFIRDYVRATGEDPARSWQMLTPKFQRESGGFDTYRSFWDAATNGRVLSIQANPEDLSVSYQVRFDDFDNGPGPTVLDLAYDDGTYRIDGERTQGFTPAG
ncbi:Serine/threonine protein kinase [Nocardioides scoriae]|uniref:non-specific serine/threonine protein kinase n=1 Tax=Nocardioides scoriae TaxID=642780 RepID=A0A1H1R2G4_9ACTN|nr:serine/threonine-protein kinase [Nocardioides scoriae]SDS29820.1 Serine/threonine protein kinase [Nocardioides scoriae]